MKLGIFSLGKFRHFEVNFNSKFDRRYHNLFQVKFYKILQNGHSGYFDNTLILFKMYSTQFPQLEPFIEEQGDINSKLKLGKKSCQQCQNSTGKLIPNGYDNTFTCANCFIEQDKFLRKYKLENATKYPQIDEILDWLYLGNQDAALDINILKEKNITNVLACGAMLLRPHQMINYKTFNIMDNPKQKIIHLFDDSYNWLRQKQQKKEKVLLHCSAGVSRSASFTIAFIMKQKDMNFQDAYAFVKNKRRCIHPNSGFKVQLDQYSSQLKKQKQSKQYH